MRSPSRRVYSAARHDEKNRRFVSLKRWGRHEWGRCWWGRRRRRRRGLVGRRLHHRHPIRNRRQTQTWRAGIINRRLHRRLRRGLVHLRTHWGSPYAYLGIVRRIKRHAIKGTFDRLAGTFSCKFTWQWRRPHDRRGWLARCGDSLLNG
jgi:hypothetical protein